MNKSMQKKVKKIINLICKPKFIRNIAPPIERDKRF